jgi:hypothetical protein
MVHDYLNDLLRVFPSDVVTFDKRNSPTTHLLVEPVGLPFTLTITEVRTFREVPTIQPPFDYEANKEWLLRIEGPYDVQTCLPAQLPGRLAEMLCSSWERYHKDVQHAGTSLLRRIGTTILPVRVKESGGFEITSCINPGLVLFSVELWNALYVLYNRDGWAISQPLPTFEEAYQRALAAYNSHVC